MVGKCLYFRLLSVCSFIARYHSFGFQMMLYVMLFTLLLLSLNILQLMESSFSFPFSHSHLLLTKYCIRKYEPTEHSERKQSLINCPPQQQPTMSATIAQIKATEKENECGKKRAREQVIDRQIERERAQSKQK